MKHLKKIAITFLSLFAACFVFAGCKVGTQNEQGTSGSIIVDLKEPTKNQEILQGIPFDFDENYYQNDVVKFPATIIYNGESVEVIPNLLYPSGKMVSATDVRFDEVGLYTLFYKSKGGDIVESRSFNVFKEIFVATSNKSSYNLGKVKDYSKYDSELEGAIVNLVNGDELAYSEIIDLSDNTKNDSLFSLKVLPPEDFGEVRTIVFTLTDIYDSANTLTFTIVRSNPYPANIMLMVNAADQKPTALEPWYTDEGFTYDGAYYRYHSGDGYGTYLVYSMEGNTEAPFNINMDYNTKRVYFNGSLCVDLDDPILFSNLWKGFSVDKCFFSMYAKDYTRNDFNFLLTNIDGKTKFGNYFEDKDAPEIMVDESDIFDVYAIAGQKFALPLATAFDVIEGNRTVDVSVFRNYGMLSQTKLHTENNSFVPLTAGLYTIIYEVKDSSGNQAIKRYDVEAKGTDATLISIETTDSGDENGIQGQKVVVSDYNVTNNNGNATVEVKAACGDVEYIVDAETLSFVPLYAGEYTITYIAKDYTSEVRTSYKLDVTKIGAISILKGMPIIPKYVIINAAHVTPKLSGYSFADGKPITKDAEVYIASTPSLDNATLLNEDTFTYSGVEGDCWFAYKIDETVEWYQSNAVDVGYGTDMLKIDEYFVGKDGTSVNATSTNTYTDYVFASTNGDTTVEFVNALQIFNFSIELVIPETHNYNKLTLAFQDIDSTKDAKFEVTIDILNNGSINCYDQVGNSCVLNKVVGNSLVIAFSAETGVMSFTCGNTANLKLSQKTMLTDNKAYFMLSADANETEMRIFSVNNQLISSQKKDLVFPQYTYNSQFGRYNKNDIVKINGVQVSDVLSPSTTVTMSVKTAEGNYITAVDGTLLNEKADYTKDYEIQLNEYTYYYVEYKISDGRNNTTYRYAFSVIDKEKPNIVIGKHNTEYVVGNTVVVGDYVVSDDTTLPENCIVYITVTMPDNRTVYLTGNSFVANIAGEYKVYYYVQDEVGNVTLESYVVTVS